MKLTTCDIEDTFPGPDLPRVIHIFLCIFIFDTKLFQKVDAGVPTTIMSLNMRRILSKSVKE